MRRCLNCNKAIPFAIVTVSLSTDSDKWLGWFCGKKCANEYLEQEIIAEQEEETPK